MKNEYRREMEQIGPWPEELERLYKMIEEAETKNHKKLGGRMAAILVCAALMVTAAAAAAPTVREAFQTVRVTLQSYLGSFAPYAQTIDGVVCADQGIEIQVLSAISDDLEARFYLAVRDLEEDRLSEFLQLDGRVVAGETKDPDRNFLDSVVGGFSANHFTLISYDPDTKTALFSTRILYQDSSRPTGEADLSISGMNTLQGEVYEYASCAAVTGTTLKSLPASKNHKVVFSPDTVAGIGYTDDVLPGVQVVLAPGQTPMSIEGTDAVRISSMGFASDGCFHIRLEFAEGMAPALSEPNNTSRFYADLMDGSDDRRYYVCQERLVEDGMDILFPLVKEEDLEELQSRQARIYGTYTRPGVEIAGDWSAQFQMDYYTSVTLDWTGELAGWQMRQVTVSPLSITMSGDSSESAGGLRVPIYAVKRDGSTVAAEPGTSQYVNAGALSGEKDGWETYAVWKLEEPVDVEDIVSLALGNEVIPVN